MIKSSKNDTNSAEYNAFLIDQLAKFLNYTEEPSELPKKYRKLLSNDGIILKYFSKKINAKLNYVEKLVKSNLFFKMELTKLTESFIFKQTKELNVVKFTDRDELVKYYNKKRKKLLADAEASDILLSRLMNVIEVWRLSPVLSTGRKVRGYVDYQPEHWSSEKLYTTFLPRELKKYRDESKAQSNIDRRFHTKLLKTDSFRFKNDMVANSLVSWFQSLLISVPEIVRDHLLAGDFERWLRNSAKEREMANICSNLARMMEDTKQDPLYVKREMLKRLRRTSFESSIFNTLTKPLIKKLQSAEQETVYQAATRLMEIGDERAVEALIERLYDSAPETRAVIINALGEIKDLRAVSPLIKIFEHSNDDNDRLNSLRALAKFNDKNCEKLIYKAASDGEGRIKEVANGIIAEWETSG